MDLTLHVIDAVLDLCLVLLLGLVLRAQRRQEEAHANTVFMIGHAVADARDTVIAVLPKTRKRRTKAELQAVNRAALEQPYDAVNDPDGRIEAEIEVEAEKLEKEQAGG